MMNLAEIKQQLRYGKYAWPGGYPKYFVAIDGSVLSFDWVRDNWKAVVNDYIGFKLETIAGVSINWEDPELICEGTGKRIESAYAEV